MANTGAIGRRQGQALQAPDGGLHPACSLPSTRSAMACCPLPVLEAPALENQTQAESTIFAPSGCLNDGVHLTGPIPQQHYAPNGAGALSGSHHVADGVVENG